MSVSNTASGGGGAAARRGAPNVAAVAVRSGMPRSAASDGQSMATKLCHA